MSVKAICRAFVEQHCATYDASHDISHIDRVVRNALEVLALSEVPVKEIIKEDVLVAIATLHDSFDHKYLTTDEAVNKAKQEVTEMLSTRCNMSESIISLIIRVIDNMGYTAEVTRNGSSGLDELTTSYLHIVQDADRLDAIGAVGVARCLAFTGAFGRPIVSPDGNEERAQRATYNRGELKPIARKGGSAIAHFYDKLVFLKDMLKTPAGRAIGEKRHQFILAFLDQFFSEIGE